MKLKLKLDTAYMYIEIIDPRVITYRNSDC